MKENLLIVLALIPAAITAHVGYLAFYPFDAIHVQPQPYVLRDTTVEAGSFIFYDFEYCRYTDVKAEVSHTLVGEVSLGIEEQPIVVPTLPDASLRLSEGCGEITKGVYIPAHTPAGVYYMQEDVDYPVNPFQTVHKVFRTEAFTVTN